MPAQPQLLIAMAVYTALLLLIFRLPVFAFLDKAEKGRDAHLDGLRFFLAIAVVYHHFLISFRYFHNLKWTFIFDENPALFRFGRYAVAGFFMLSAYLFADRRFDSLKSLTTFYVKRMLRIMPIAYIVTFTFLVIAFTLNFEIGADQSIHRLHFWLDAFISPFVPYHDSVWMGLAITCGVMWTLSYEWILYASLPVISRLKMLVGPIRFSILGIFVGTVIFTSVSVDHLRFLICFPLGMLARDLKGKFHLPSVQKDLLISFFIVILFLLKTDPASPLNLCLLFVPFYLIVNGSNFFDLLNARGAVRLGEASFSIYLMHGTFFFLFNWFTRPLSFSPSVNLTCLFILIFTICGLSTLTYRFIELPFMRLSHRRQPRLQLQRKS